MDNRQLAYQVGQRSAGSTTWIANLLIKAISGWVWVNRKLPYAVLVCVFATRGDSVSVVGPGSQSANTVKLCICLWGVMRLQRVFNSSPNLKLGIIDAQRLRDIDSPWLNTEHVGPLQGDK